MLTVDLSGLGTQADYTDGEQGLLLTALAQMAGFDFPPTNSTFNLTAISDLSKVEYEYRASATATVSSTTTSTLRFF